MYCGIRRTCKHLFRRMHDWRSVLRRAEPTCVTLGLLRAAPKAISTSQGKQSTENYSRPTPFVPGAPWLAPGCKPPAPRHVPRLVSRLTPNSQ